MPIGPRARQWATARARRTVLVVAHTVTALTRLEDVLAVFDSDPRIQVLFTAPQTSAFSDGVDAFLHDIGARVIPWSQATSTRFDLALSASQGGNLQDIDAPLIVLSHGIGYNKILETGNRKPETGNRKPETGNRKPETGNRKPVFGLAREQLLHEGRLVPAKLILSHDEQRARLAEYCPEALPAAVVAGDPCYDRLLASTPWRAAYRSALGLGDDQILVAISSTWGERSLLGRRPDLPARLLADLPADRYRVAAIVHPNVWYGHGPWQLRAWLTDATRAGLLRIPPRDGWRAALVAADCVVGDHGSVTFYGAAIDRPVVLATFPHADVDPASPIAAFGRRAPRLRDHGRLREQLDDAIGTGSSGRYADLVAQTIAAPGGAARILRAAMYESMHLEPPPNPPRVAPAPLPHPEPVYWPDGPLTPTFRAVVTVERGGPGHRPQMCVRRHPVEVEWARTVELPSAHLVVDDTEPDPRLRHAGDVLVRRGTQLDANRGAAAAEVLAREPNWSCVADVETRCCTLTLRHNGGTTALHASLAAAEDDGTDPAILASAAYGWHARGGEPSALASGLTVDTGAGGPVTALFRPLTS